MTPYLLGNKPIILVDTNYFSRGLTLEDLEKDSVTLLTTQRVMKELEGIAIREQQHKRYLMKRNIPQGTGRQQKTQQALSIGKKLCEHKDNIITKDISDYYRSLGNYTPKGMLKFAYNHRGEKPNIRYSKDFVQLLRKTRQEEPIRTDEFPEFLQSIIQKNINNLPLPDESKEVYKNHLTEKFHSLMQLGEYEGLKGTCDTDLELIAAADKLAKQGNSVSIASYDGDIESLQLLDKLLQPKVRNRYPIGIIRDKFSKFF